MSKQKKKLAKTASLLPRPPVVSILGHIDHGKTTLLDKIRQTNIAASESGGITQEIGAYQVEFKQQKITFIDTPGHAAFAKMRARGAKVTDLAILVVASDEGVKPQTKESLKFIKEAKIPFLVAATKIDLSRSDLEKTMGELEKIGVKVEKRGGKIVMVPVSAKEGKGIDDLLEMILLLAEMEGLKADPQGKFRGVVVESKLDRRRGVLATVLVKNGTLRTRDQVWAGEVAARVKAMFDENGARVSEALPSKPVEVLGFEAVPEVGSVVAGQARFLIKEEPVAKKNLSKAAPEETDAQASGAEKLRLILKADAKGTLEAVKLNLPTEVELVSTGVGDITESDILLSQTTNSRLIGFRVCVPNQVKKLAQVEKVGVKNYTIIYELLGEITKLVEKMLKPKAEEEILGKAEILKEFTAGNKKIIGCQVLEGRIAKGDQVRLHRGEKELGAAKVISLKKGKLDAKNAKVEEECGVMLKPQLDFMPADVLVSFRKLPS